MESLKISFNVNTVEGRSNFFVIVNLISQWNSNLILFIAIPYLKSLPQRRMYFHPINSFCRHYIILHKFKTLYKISQIVGSNAFLLNSPFHSGLMCNVHYAMIVLVYAGQVISYNKWDFSSSRHFHYESEGLMLTALYKARRAFITVPLYFVYMNKSL